MRILQGTRDPGDSGIFFSAEPNPHLLTTEKKTPPQEALPMPPPSDQRIAACWRMGDCHQCIHSPARCGWCASSNLCVPATSLLEPVSNAGACPLRRERWELRTRALGCGCSTTTLLSVVGAVVATLAALALGYVVVRVVVRVHRVFGMGAGRGTERFVDADGGVRERRWRRRARDADGGEREWTTERRRLMG